MHSMEASSTSPASPPKRLWLGSTNGTESSRLGLEFGVWLDDPDLLADAEQFLVKVMRSSEGIDPDDDLFEPEYVSVGYDDEASTTQWATSTTCPGKTTNDPGSTSVPCAVAEPRPAAASRRCRAGRVNGGRKGAPAFAQIGHVLGGAGGEQAVQALQPGAGGGAQAARRYPVEEVQGALRGIGRLVGFPDLLVLFGIALLVDPWDIVWNTLRPLFLRLTTDSEEPVVWDLTIPDVLTRALRVPWGAAAVAATALSLATLARGPRPRPAPPPRPGRAQHLRRRRRQ
ncbi:hypothetical protein ACFXKC_50375 [Streptomyces sp. NPDC059340]|uniref:hypothetical protein n=1 Tax=Streptomyces sp. NPDC059340 TaxID=3346806 RepID=UPI0036AF0649